MGKSTRQALLGLPGPVMITGHTGFKGVWMTLLLERLGVEVAGLSLAPKDNSLFAKLNRQGAVVEKFIDIRNYDEVSRFVEHVNPSTIFHFAAQPLVLESFSNPMETFGINTMGTVNILDIAHKSKSIKFVITTTTDKVYKNDNSGKHFSEEDALEGRDPYSASKVGAEAAIKAWQELSSISGGPKIISVRAGNVVGGGDMSENRLLPDIVRSLINQETIMLRNPNSTRPWQHVLDPLHGYLLVLAKAIGGECAGAYNFGPTSSSITVSEVAEIAINLWDPTRNIENLTPSHEREKETKILNLNSDLSRVDLNWENIWTQKESVEDTIKWWHRISVEKHDINSVCESDLDKLFAKLKWN
jgi:CDP-glucose 4,6-dehydratase